MIGDAAGLTTQESMENLRKMQMSGLGREPDVADLEITISNSAPPIFIQKWRAKKKDLQVINLIIKPTANCVFYARFVGADNETKIDDFAKDFEKAFVSENSSKLWSVRKIK